MPGGRLAQVKSYVRRLTTCSKSKAAANTCNGARAVDGSDVFCNNARTNFTGCRRTTEPPTI